MAIAAELEAMPSLVLFDIFTELDARDVAAASCVSTRLCAAASDDSVWRRLLSRDLDLDDPVDPDENLCASYKEAYRRWVESFGMYPLPLVKRVKKCWTSLRSWLAANYPEANNTLRKGASEAELKWVEDTLEVKLPVPTRILYRFCDGQQTLTPYPAECQKLASLGIIGGYEFYDHLVNVHLLPLNLIVTETKKFAPEIPHFKDSKLIVVAASWYMSKYFILNCDNAQLYVGTKYLIEGEMMPCVPQELINPTVGTNNDMAQDALLLWLEEHSRRLQSGIIRTRLVRKKRSISLFPEAPCSIAITNGVKVRASAVLVPESSDLNGEEKEYLYVYSIRMSLLSDGCRIGGTCYSSCQLYSRHWVIRSGENVVSDVTGEAVIGKFPLLIMGKEEFVYESCTPLPDAPGSVEGCFIFVPGSLQKPQGSEFIVKVAPFILEEPKYIF